MCHELHCELEGPKQRWPDLSSPEKQKKHTHTETITEQQNQQQQNFPPNKNLQNKKCKAHKKDKNNNKR